MRNAVKHRVTARQCEKRKYQKRKNSGLCTYGGCREKPKVGHNRCQEHLDIIREGNTQLFKTRKARGLCIHCGVRPQFWGVRCLICRQLVAKRKDPLPFGARKALKMYRKAERQRDVEQIEVNARFAVRVLLLGGSVSGDHAKALHLYAGLDDRVWRTHLEVASVMHVSAEHVRQLLYPSKIRLQEILHGEVPWRAVIPIDSHPWSRRRANRQMKYRPQPPTSIPSLPPRWLDELRCFL